MRHKEFIISDTALAVLLEVLEFGQTRKPVHRMLAEAIEKFIRNELKGCVGIDVIHKQKLCINVCQATFYANYGLNKCRFTYEH